MLEPRLLELSISEALGVLKPLGILVLELLVYSIFIFRFYRFLARRDIIGINLQRYDRAGHRFLRAIVYVIQYIVLVPIFTFFWFAALAAFLSLMGKTQTPQSILLVSIAVVSVVRATAYYSEDLSKDIAKLLPFAVLGLYIIDLSYFELSVSLGLLREMPSEWKLLVYYLMFAVALEFILRIGYALIRAFSPRHDVSSSRP